ncbi:facilitated trehalose transporter Tret1 [Halyomorpha halys]|uniref:facilitated trehalose transporter Tret1 n=1 Tax=Halyomorpha halys TaxID=286706 RepID=UPI0006D4EC27|nr:facilitated trehalose transporter Tret1 [Halyomorpha halys]
MFHHLYSPGPLGQWIVAFTACLCSFTCGQAFSWPAPALPKIRSGSTGFSVTAEEESWMVTIMFLGNILSPIPAGMVMNRIGRKNSLHLFVLIAIASWLLIYVNHSVQGLFIARLLVGIWAGFVYTLVPILIGEVVDPAIRGSMGSLFGVMLYLGGMYESLIGLYVSYDVLTLVSLIPPVLVFLLFSLLPESPYFHLMKGDRRLAAESMEWLQGSSKEVELDFMEECVKEQLENRSSFLDLFQVKANRKAFLMAQILAGVQRAAGLTLLMSYASVTIPDSFVTGEQSFTILDSVWILASIFSFFIMDRFDRKTLLFVSSLGSCITMVVVFVWYFLRDYTDLDTSTTLWLPLVLFIINGIFYSIGLVSIPTLVQGELFPVNIKGKASALASITMSAMSALTTKAYQPLTDNVGVFANFVICASSCGIGAFFAATYMTETRGKTLEEIQDLLTQKKRKKKKIPV